MNFPRRFTTLIAATVTAAGLVSAGAAAADAAGPALRTLLTASRVAAKPAYGTPELALTKQTQTVRQLVQCGSRVYAAGSFATIKWRGTTYHRGNAFSFSATAPYRVTSWNPGVNGVVNSITLSSDCSHAYLGGSFTKVHGRAATDIAEVSASTGALTGTFGHYANRQVETLRRHGGHILAGGYFTKVNGSTADPYLASLDPRTGKDDGYARLHIAGHYVYPGVHDNPSRVYNQQVSHNGSYDLIEGDFTSVGGMPRQQIAMLRLGSAQASVTGWTSSDFSNHCADGFPFYIRAAAWSPDDSEVYLATTGYHALGWTGPAWRHPLYGLCDAAAGYPAKRTSVRRDWINYTGCDSLYAAAADATTVYIGGHERWAHNRYGCDHEGKHGAVRAPGMAGLSPGTGSLVFNPTRARGRGADDMLLTKAGLWIASDTYENSQTCGGISGHAGICFLRYPH